MDGYRSWLETTAETLQEAIADAENSEWHHADPHTPVGRIYSRLLTWSSEVESRRRYYDAAQRT